MTLHSSIVPFLRALFVNNSPLIFDDRTSAAIQIGYKLIVFEVLSRYVPLAVAKSLLAIALLSRPNQRLFNNLDVDIRPIHNQTSIS